ncbi:hypothetical protein [Halorientalis litorea]|uniref:hypothetical protein n=1 Tax=Halorientalis litorea TaxID=2931977 RepID=UPI001FF61EA0|nr:hypothetical protein [Halorientalis litorea]
MVEDRITDGRRIGQLLASEVTGRESGVLGDMAVVDADPDADPTDDGTFAYRVALAGDPIAETYVHPDRLRIELLTGVERGAAAAERADLRVRPKAVEPPRTLVFVESGAEVKSAVDVVAVANERESD